MLTSQPSAAQAVCSRQARSNRSVQIVREDGEHFPWAKWQVSQAEKNLKKSQHAAG